MKKNEFNIKNIVEVIACQLKDVDGNFKNAEAIFVLNRGYILNVEVLNAGTSDVGFIIDVLKFDRFGKCINENFDFQDCWGISDELLYECIEDVITRNKLTRVA